MNKFIYAIIFIFISPSAYTAGFSTEREIREFSDNIISLAVSGKHKEAFDLAKPYWPIPEVEIDGVVNQVQLQAPMIEQRFGKSLSHEFITEKRIGNSLLRLYYLHKFEKHLMYWQLDFYKPENEWKINTIIFLDNIEPLFRL